mgnify:CR=1 FL=1
MMSSLYKKIKKIPFINCIPKIEATAVPLAASGSSILAPVAHLLLFINKARGFFHFLPLASLPSSSASRPEALKRRRRHPPQSFYLISGRCINLK